MSGSGWRKTALDITRTHWLLMASITQTSWLVLSHLNEASVNSMDVLSIFIDAGVHVYLHSEVLK